MKRTYQPTVVTLSKLFRAGHLKLSVIEESSALVVHSKPKQSLE